MLLLITIARVRPSCQRLLRNADGLEHRRRRVIFLWNDDNNNKKTCLLYIIIIITHPVAFDDALYRRENVRYQISVEQEK